MKPQNGRKGKHANIDEPIQDDNNNNDNDNNNNNNTANSEEDRIIENSQTNNKSWICRNIDRIFADRGREKVGRTDMFCSKNAHKFCHKPDALDSNKSATGSFKATSTHCDTEPQIREVIIIGNGPSALTLSFILSGHWPYYSRRHPLEGIHRRLSSIYSPDSERQTSLIECDLSKLSSGLLGRTLNPVSLLFDQLQNPNSDFGVGEPLPSCLEWRFNPKCAIDHLVLGQGLPGGLWYHLRKSKTIFTVSRRLWMQLPGLAIEHSPVPALDDASTPGLSRVSYRQIFDYYQNYVDKYELGNNFRNHSQVVKVEWNGAQNLWVIDALCKVPIKPNDRRRNAGHLSLKSATASAGSPPIFKTCKMRYYARKVVLATGASASSSPSHLNIDGEEHKFVIHSLSHFETVLQAEKSSLVKLSMGDRELYQTKPKVLIIVGSGLSSADALSIVRGANFKILHVFRRSVTDRTMIFNQLSNQNLYPEYSSVHRQMKQSVKTALCFDCFMSTPSLHYQAYQKCVLDSVEVAPITFERLASLHFLEEPTKHCSACHGPIVLSNIVCDYVLVLIGSKPKLDYLCPPELRNSLGRMPEAPIDIRHNPIKIEPSSHECSSFKNLYAMGPLVGDSFVRFVQGGALAIASHLWQNMPSSTEQSSTKT